MKPILAVIVLYKMQLAESASYTTLTCALREDPALADRISLMLFDNSPGPQAVSAESPALYRHDGANPGLAARYNEALAFASQTGASWLLLLDQDTELTHAYLAEVVRLANELEGDRDIAAIIPKLVSRGRLLSPHPPSYRGQHEQYQLSTNGRAAELLRAFNSGALMRLAWLQQVGGFPEDFWLDYLDHAIFHRLQTAGGNVWIMQAALEHDLSMLREASHTGEANASRHRNMLAAELRFYHQHGTEKEQRRHRKDLVRRAAAAARGGHLTEATRLLRAALGHAPGSGNSVSESVTRTISGGRP